MANAPKRRRQDPDSFHRLSTDLLCKIVSMLPTDDAVRTSVLAKRWRNVYTAHTDFHFREERNDHEILRRFYDRMKKHIYNIDNPGEVKNFTVECHLELAFLHHEEEWFKRMTGIQRLNFKFLNASGRYSDKCPMPPDVYNLRALINMNIRGFVITNPQSGVEWNSLCTLCIEDSRMDFESIQTMLDGSENLQCLKLITCEGILQLDTGSNKKLQTLFIDEVSDDRGIELVIPHVECLQMMGHLMGTVRLRNGQSLRVVVLTFEYSPISPNDRAVHKLLGALKHVTELEIGTCAIQSLSSLSLQDRQRNPFQVNFSLSSCKRLILKTHMSVVNFPGIKCLLQSAPHLEALVLRMPSEAVSQRDRRGGEFRPLDGRTYWDHCSESFECLERNLTSVELVLGFRRSEWDMGLKFLAYLLAHGKVLKLVKLKICNHTGQLPNRRLQIEDVHKLPRAHQDVKIEVTYN